MTEAQTVIFLKSLRQRVELAIEQTESLLPVDAPREKRWRHKQANALWPCLCNRYLTPDHWEESDAAFVATGHLESLLSSLDEDIELLTKSVEAHKAA